MRTRWDLLPRRVKRPGMLAGGDGSTLSLDFTAMSGLDSRFTFTRASTATYINSSGLVTTMAAASTNDPTKARFDHDPTTLAPRGLLIEGSATSLVTQSSAMNNWTFTRTTASTPSVTAPDGASTSVLVTGTADVNNHLVQNANSISFTPQNYTFSVWLKAGATNFAQLSFTNSVGFPTNTYVNVNLSNGTLGTLGGTGATATISTAYPNGWYRVTLTANQTSTTSHTGSCLIYLISSATAPRAEASWDASSASVYVFGAQLEAGSGASSYIPTAGSTVQRAADQMTMANISALSFNQAGGTVFMQIEGNPKDVNTFPYFAAFEQSPSGRGWSFLRLNNSTSSGLRMLGTAFTGAGSSIINSSNHTRPSGKFKFATTLEPSVCRMTYVIAGGSALVDTAAAGTLATIGSLKFNNTTETSAADFGSVWISQFKYWPSVLPNATLQSLTQ